MVGGGWFRTEYIVTPSPKLLLGLDLGLGCDNNINQGTFYCLSDGLLSDCIEDGSLTISSMSTDVERRVLNYLYLYNLKINRINICRDLFNSQR